MAGARATLAVLLVVALAAVATRTADSVITCGTVFSNLTPCINYLTTGGACPPACCTGIRTLNDSAKSTPDRQAVCGCVKTAAAGVRGVNFARAAALPGLCKVSIPYKLSPSTDCSRVM